MKKYSPSEFGRLIGVSYPTLIRWEKTGKLIPNYTKGKRRYYTEQHLEQHLKIRSKKFAETKKEILFRKFL